MREDERSSQNRLRAAAKVLFAQKGYESTAIADITRAAKTSHSQFLKYYSGKEDLRREIIDQQWAELSRSVTLAITSVASPVEKLKLALNMFISLLEGDPEFRTILLLEHTASRNQNGIVVSRQFGQFVALVDDILVAVKDHGQLQLGVNVHALRSALVGCIEGLMRDQLLGVHGLPAEYSLDDVRRLLAMLVSGACETTRPVAASEITASNEAVLKSSEDEWIRYYLKLADKALNPSELS